MAYASCSLQPHEKNYGITEMEGLGVVSAVKHFRHYLYGQKCHVYTDHEALKALLNTPKPSGKLARWGMALQELDSEIHYRPGRKNANADALSRAPLPESHAMDSFSVVAAVSTKDTEEASCLSQAQLEDPDLRVIVTYLEHRILPEDEKLSKSLALTQSQYLVQDSILYFVEGDGTLRVIPPTKMREKLFKEAHGGRCGGHLGEVKIYSELNRHYWWPTMRKTLLSGAEGA